MSINFSAVIFASPRNVLLQGLFVCISGWKLIMSYFDECCYATFILPLPHTNYWNDRYCLHTSYCWCICTVSYHS